MNAIIETINAAGQAFIEFALPMLIQSSVLILILLVVDVLLRRRVRAVFRYWIWMLVLLKLVLPPSLWSPVSIGTWLGETLEPPQVAINEPLAPQPQMPPAEWQPQAKLGDGAPVAVNHIHQWQTSAPEMPGVAAATDSSPMAAPDPDQSAITEPAPDKARLAQDDALQPSPALGWQALALLVWSAIASALLLLLLQRAWFVRGLVAQAQDAPPRLRTVLDQCRSRMHLNRPIAIRVSPNATSPAVCGLFRPVILIPRTLVPRLQPHDLDAILLHELAHIKRGDLWVNLIQTLLQIVYFYNLLLWLANAMIRRVREQAVDEAVLVAMGETAHDYPETLLHIAKLAFHRRPALSLRLIGVVESKSALAARIKHILARPLPKTARLGLAGLATVAIIGAILLPMARAERSPLYIRGIDERLGVSDKSGHLTIRSLHMALPDGRRLAQMNETLLHVGIENTSQQDSYLGLEYYADAGTVAGAFSPGASARTVVLRVPANWQGTLTYPVAYPRFVHDGYIRIVLAECSDLQTTRFLSPEAEVLHEKTYPVFTDKQSQDSGDRFSLLPDCRVWLSDIDGQDLPVLDLASESIITLPKVESDFRLLQTTTSRGEGDVLYYYDRAKGLPKITFLRGAALGDALGDASVSDNAETRTIIPPELPWQATLTTAEKARYEIRITRADEHGCVIYFHPVKDASDLPKVILPGGVAVELVGLCEHPSAGRNWWRSDGSPLDEAPQKKVDRNVHPSPSETAYEFAVQLHDLPDGAAVTMKTDPGGSRTNGTGLDGLHWLATSLPNDLQECQLLVGIAAGPWETTAGTTGESHITHGTQLGGVMFSEAVVSDGDGITITVTDDIVERPCRVVAVTINGRTVVASPIEMGQAGQARQTAAHFKKIAIEDIAEFQFQTRSWTWVTFRNVSLKPGHETDVAVDAQAALEDGTPQASDTDASGMLPLTERAGKVMPLAEQEARRLNHAYVGTEHILLALARQENAVSAKVLANLGADLHTLRSEVNRFVRPGSAPVTRRTLPRVPRAERIMSYAREEAQALHHDYIGTEHILLVLLREPDNVAAQVLASSGITQAQLRAEILNFVRPGADGFPDGYETEPQEYRVVLPDVDREAVLLDLASGQLVAIPRGVSEANMRQAILDLGKGDLVFDAHSLVLVRGTTSEQAERMTGEPFSHYPIGERLPEVLMVTTAEQRRYRITVLEVDQGTSCTLEVMRFPDDEGAGGAAPVDPPEAQSSAVVAKLPNGVTVEFLAYSQLTPEELRWWTLDGESTTIPDVYQADVEGHGVLLALRIEPEPEYALAWSYQPPDIRHALKFWRMEGSNIWLAALGQQRNYVNVEIYARLKDPPAVQSVSIQEKDADGEIRIGAHGSQKIIGLTAVDSNTTQFLVTSMVDGPRVVAAQDTSGRLHRVRLLSEVPLPRDPSDPKGQRYQVDMSLNDLAGIVIEGVAARGGGVKFRNIPLTGKQPGQLRMEIAPGTRNQCGMRAGSLRN